MIKKTNNKFILEVFSLVKDEYVFLEKYISTHTPIFVKHNKCGNIYKVSPANFLRGKRCPKCYLESKLRSKFEFENQFYNVAQNEYLLLSEYMGSDKKIKVRHNRCGYEYSVRATGFLNDNRRCPLCSGKMKTTNEEFLKKIYEIGNGEYVAIDKYINEKTPIKFKHINCGTVFNVKPNEFIWGRRRCPQCKTKSIGEKIIEEYLTKNAVNFEAQKKFADCVYKKELMFDFFLIDYNTCIEFDGIQHYKLCFNKGEEEFNNQLVRDEIKNQYCKINNIGLLRIPYWNINEIKEILFEHIKLVNEMQKSQKGVKNGTDENNGN